LRPISHWGFRISDFTLSGFTFSAAVHFGFQIAGYRLGNPHARFRIAPFCFVLLLLALLIDAMAIAKSQ